MEDFKKKNSTRIAHLLVITKLDTSLIFIAEKTDYNADKTIIVGLVYSDNSDVYSFLRTTCGNCTDSSFAASHLHDIRLGNAGFDDRVTVVKDTSINVVRSEISAKLISALLW